MKFFILLFAPILIFSQDFPQDYFQSPLDIPIDLSGSFGELRSNHFHSGLDLKTRGVEGLPVYAAGDGYISRIKISTFGYGKAIYITHPNGYTSVYGHLQKANGLIESFIKERQYKGQSYEIEMYLYPTELPVKKGDIIAFSGNTGGSGGPHLHFEFRNTKSEEILNPMHFGFKKIIKDDRKPVIQGLVAYPLDSTTVNNSQKPINISFSKQSDGNYLGVKVKADGKVAFGINAYDFCTNAYNKNGLYKVKTYLNGVLQYQYGFDGFTFDESRYINNFIDYERFHLMGQRIQKLFQISDYPLSILASNKKDGIIKVQPGVNYTYRVELYDFHGNKVELVIPIEFAYQEAKIEKTFQITPYFVKAKNEAIFEKNNVSVQIPENAFYSNFYLSFDVNNDILTLHDDSVPVHKNITITFNEVKGLTEEQLAKTYIATLDGYKLDYNKTYRKGNSFSIKTKTLGKFKLAQDTTPPRIYNVNFVEGKTIKEQKTISVSVTDLHSDIDSYNAYLNGKWILMEYDYKTKKLVHNLDDNICVQGRNDLKIVVTDNLQNSTTFESYFFR
ncbi:peptidoglycan DD-metalloendopeptidase family protein [Flavobacterium sp. LMO8]|uniref:M23 family metallopeptidase n=1 Tax=Flavobacterium sp. LMO8 TaxID=2654244 RepID=UPI001292166C|nr:M23 family metallopeptidase [Flavobacterium sp. LMO8]MQP23747.1 peptidoglycan DD-metalloendopeptidase family protein [Flavobacterium sp. LMO8]